MSGFLYMAVIQFTSPETMSFGHSITLLASMVIGGAASIVGSLLGGAYYVLVPQWSNQIDPNLTELLQGALLLLVLFLLPRRPGLAAAGGRTRAATGPCTSDEAGHQNGPRTGPRTGHQTGHTQTPSARPAPERAEAEEIPSRGGIPTERQ